MTSPNEMHFHLVKKILRYLQGTITYGLRFTKCNNFSINAYSNYDSVANINTRKSIIGYVVFLGSNPILWQSKKQSTVSRSSIEA